MNTCATCKWWTPPQLDDAGVCNRITYDYPQEAAHITDPGEVYTCPDFGCTLWDGKG